MDYEIIFIAMLIAAFPLGYLLAWLGRRLTEAATATPELRRNRDAAEINANRCPDCGAKDSLCTGPSGGMAQNIACDQCHMEFNVGFGFGTGAFMVDRSGRLSESRARHSFGFQDADFPPKVQP